MEVKVKLGGDFRNIKKYMDELEYNSQAKIFRPACRAALKTTQKYVAAGFRSILGGEMGSVLASGMHIRNRKARSKKGNIDLTIKIKPAIHRMMTYYTTTTLVRLKYWLPSAVEAGHAKPYQSKYGVKQVKKRLPFFQFDEEKDKGRVAAKPAGKEGAKASGKATEQALIAEMKKRIFKRL